MKVRTHFWLTVFIILGLIFSGIVFFLVLTGRLSISAEEAAPTPLPAAALKYSGVPSEVSQSQNVSFEIQIVNSGPAEIPQAILLLRGKGVKHNSSEGRPLKEEEIAYFKLETTDPGVAIPLGKLPAGESLRKKINLSVTATDLKEVVSLAKLFQIKTQPDKECAAKDCPVAADLQLLTEAETTAELKALTAKELTLKTNPGYNFITLPFTLSENDLKDFLKSFKIDWLYRYDPETLSWKNLLEGENFKILKPGVGFFAYDTQATDYALPKQRLAPELNQAYSVEAKTGYNQLGNPYPYRIRFFQDKILVRRPGDSTLSNLVSFKEAILRGIVTNPTVLYSNLKGDNGISETKFMTVKDGSFVEAFQGFYLKATEKIELIFPGRDVLAPSQFLTEEEKLKISRYLVDQKLDTCGNQPTDSASNPLYDENLGQVIDQFDCLLLNHPERPWSSDKAQ